MQSQMLHNWLLYWKRTVLQSILKWWQLCLCCTRWNICGISAYSRNTTHAMVASHMQRSQLSVLCISLIPDLRYRYLLYVHCVSKKPDPCDIFKHIKQIWTNILFWYAESSIKLLSSDTDTIQCWVSSGTTITCSAAFSGWWRRSSCLACGWDEQCL